jgi:hypothetical protein
LPRIRLPRKRLRMQRGPPGEMGTPFVISGAGGDVRMARIFEGDPDDPFAEDMGWR